MGKGKRLPPGWVPTPAANGADRDAGYPPLPLSDIAKATGLPVDALRDAVARGWLVRRPVPPNERIGPERAAP